MTATSLRLLDEDAPDLVAVAFADEMTQSEVVRLALREYFDRRCEDDDFQQRLQALFGSEPESSRTIFKEASMSVKVLTLRPPEPMAKKLGAIARAEEVHPVSEVLREGIEEMRR